MSQRKLGDLDDNETIHRQVKLGFLKTTKQMYMAARCTCVCACMYICIYVIPYILQYIHVYTYIQMGKFSKNILPNINNNCLYLIGFQVT